MNDYDDGGLGPDFDEWYRLHKDDPFVLREPEPVKPMTMPLKSNDRGIWKYSKRTKKVQGKRICLLMCSNCGYEINENERRKICPRCCARMEE